MSNYYSNGKLLLTGEYLVLDGALSLALPTQFGQSLEVSLTDTKGLCWQSYDHNNEIWFQDEFKIEDNRIVSVNDTNEISARLVEILNAIQELNPNFAESLQGRIVKNRLDFNTSWGLGTSSTLINNLANWANVNPYELLNRTFGGSGYDIACASHNTPITYQLEQGKSIVNELTFNPSFKAQLYFVYLNKKQNSRSAIAQYQKKRPIEQSLIEAISEITKAIVTCNTVADFQRLIQTHESIIGGALGLNPVKKELFNDFYGSLKSLGAWGGDFILACSETDPSDYFKSKGLHTIIPYSELILP